MRAIRSRTTVSWSRNSRCRPGVVIEQPRIVGGHAAHSGLRRYDLAMHGRPCRRTNGPYRRYGFDRLNRLDYGVGVVVVSGPVAIGRNNGSVIVIDGIVTTDIPVTSPLRISRARCRCGSGDASYRNQGCHYFFHDTHLKSLTLDTLRASTLLFERTRKSGARFEVNQRAQSRRLRCKLLLLHANGAEREMLASCVTTRRPK